MNQAKVLDVKIDLIDKKELLQIVKTNIEKDKKTEIFTVNNEFLVDAQTNHKFREILNSSDINIIDSTGVVWALKKQGISAERLPGADMLLDICELCAEKKFKIFLFGSINSAATRTANVLKLKYPNIQIAGIIENIDINPEKVDEEIVRQINQTRPDIIFVALGAPRQEIWIRNNKSKLHTKIFMGVGGTFDYVSGLIPRAPSVMRELGLEWLFRLIIQPSRYKRIYKALVTFPSLVRKSPNNQINS
jgi:N-acetylglucosaminyldiphosphoundecaprenol N-acetyl-beta-D-mannosaminyltransferase